MLTTALRKSKRLDLKVLPPEITDFLVNADGTFQTVTIVPIVNGSAAVEAYLSYTVEAPLEDKETQLSLTEDLVDRPVMLKRYEVGRRFSDGESEDPRKREMQIGKIKHVTTITDPKDPDCTVVFHGDNERVSAGVYKLSELSFFVNDAPDIT